MLELQAETQGSQSCLVEPPAGRQVPHPQGDVVYRRSADGGLSSPFVLRLGVSRLQLRLLPRGMQKWSLLLLEIYSPALYRGIGQRVEWGVEIDSSPRRLWSYKGLDAC